jgi:dipeptidase D
MSDQPFAGLEPALLWQHFAAFTRIPRPSGQEQAISDHVTSWAEKAGYEVRRDGSGNLCVVVPASPGREQAPVVVIQGHLDMVCERNSDSPYDAEKDPLHVVREGDWLTAEGTTLGSDNGIGVAAGMAVADDESVPHGPLELLMTLDEETGMTGAMTLDPELVRGRIMLNLDSEEDGVLFVGCAGGTDTRTVFTPEREAPPAGTKPFVVSVSGLKGGHSGLDIAKNHQNAIHALARVLEGAGARAPFRLSSFDGGSKRNAIPREARAVVFLAPDAEAGFREGAEQVRATLVEQFQGVDDGLVVKVEPADGAAPDAAFTAASGERLLALLRALPSGVLAMSQDIEGLVETSTNLGVATSQDDGRVELISCTRSSVAPALRGALDQLQSVARLAGAGATEHGAYPGWKPNMASTALAKTKQAYVRLFGNEPEVTAIHAGLECGLIGERMPGMDMISFGPDIRGAHSPDERVHIPSVARFWQLLGAVLDDLSR